MRIYQQEDASGENGRNAKSKNIGIFRVAGSTNIMKEGLGSKPNKSSPTNQKVKNNMAIVIVMILTTLIRMTKGFDFRTGII